MYMYMLCCIMQYSSTEILPKHQRLEDDAVKESDQTIKV